MDPRDELNGGRVSPGERVSPYLRCKIRDSGAGTLSSLSLSLSLSLSFSARDIRFGLSTFKGRACLAFMTRINRHKGRSWSISWILAVAMALPPRLYLRPVSQLPSSRSAAVVLTRRGFFDVVCDESPRVASNRDASSMYLSENSPVDPRRLEPNLDYAAGYTIFTMYPVQNSARSLDVGPPCSGSAIQSSEMERPFPSVVVVATMLPLIAGYDHNPAVVSLPSRVPRYSRGQGKCRDIARLPAR